MWCGGSVSFCRLTDSNPQNGNVQTMFPEINMAINAVAIYRPLYPFTIVGHGTALRAWELPQDVTMDNPGSKPSKSGWQKIRQFAQDEATYFRVHLLCFTIIPLTASAVFFACNGRFHVSYIDSLFLCYSAMTVTGTYSVHFCVQCC